MRGGAGGARPISAQVRALVQFLRSARPISAQVNFAEHFFYFLRFLRFLEFVLDFFLALLVLRLTGSRRPRQATGWLFRLRFFLRRTRHPTGKALSPMVVLAGRVTEARRVHSSNAFSPMVSSRLVYLNWEAARKTNIEQIRPDLLDQTLLNKQSEDAADRGN